MNGVQFSARSLRKEARSTKHHQIIALATDGFSRREIANRVGTTLGTVNVAIWRAKQRGDLADRTLSLPRPHNVPFEAYTRLKAGATARGETMAAFLTRLLIDASEMVDAIRDDL